MLALILTLDAPIAYPPNTVAAVVTTEFLDFSASELQLSSTLSSGLDIAIVPIVPSSRSS